MGLSKTRARRPIVYTFRRSRQPFRMCSFFRKPTSHLCGMTHTTIPAPVLALLVPLQLPTEAFKYFEDSEIPSTRPNGIKSYTVRYPDPQFGEVLELSSRDIEF